MNDLTGIVLHFF